MWASLKEKRELKYGQREDKFLYGKCIVCSEVSSNCLLLRAESELIKMCLVISKSLMLNGVVLVYDAI